jgi:hypothetical protein
MKAKMILTVLCFIGVITVANAQDVIITLEGDEISARVIEVSAKNVKYRETGHVATDTLPKSKIFMIKYENGEKDVFGETVESESKEVRPPAPGPRQPRTTPQQPRTAPRQPPPAPRRGYVGFGFGPAYMADESSDDAGIQFNINFGYLISRHVGINTSFFTTASDYIPGNTGILFGPLFSFGPSSGRASFDLRPTLGYAVNDATDEGGVAAGAGASFRWSCGRAISMATNLDYYYGRDVHSIGLSLSLYFRLK